MPSNPLKSDLPFAYDIKELAAPVNADTAVPYPGTNAEPNETKSVANPAKSSFCCGVNLFQSNPLLNACEIVADLEVSGF